MSGSFVRAHLDGHLVTIRVGLDSSGGLDDGVGGPAGAGLSGEGDGEGLGALSTSSGGTHLDGTSSDNSCHVSLI